MIFARALGSLKSSTSLQMKLLWRSPCLPAASHFQGFVSSLMNSLSPIDIPQSTANDAFSQLLFTFLMHPRTDSCPPLEKTAWYAPVIHFYKRLSAALVEFEAPIDAQLRSCLESILLKLSGVVLCVVYYFSVQCTRDKNYTGTSEIWRAKKGPTESASVCKQLHALRTLGLCDITGDAVKRIEEASSCGAFIEALQSECVSEFKRCSGALVVRLL